jgi:MFS family permease
MSKTAWMRGDKLAAMAALMILLGGQAMATMDDSILAVAAPSLRADLHASGGELQLVVVMYMMAVGALVVTGARLGDIIGRTQAFVYGVGAFTLASLVGGLAPDVQVLIVARTFQGVAAALMMPQVLSIIQTQFEGQRRARAIGTYSMILAAGVAAGQILGGILVGAHLLAAAWRPALLANAPVGAVLLAGSRRVLPRISPGSGRRLDLGGVALLTTAMLALVAPLSLGRDYGWPAWVWPCFAGCAIAGLAFVALERRLKARGGYPLFDLGVLQRPGVVAGVLAVLLIMACYSGFLLSLTLFLQTDLGFSPLRAGLVFVIYATGFAVACLTWSNAGDIARARMPVLGPLVMGVALLAIGLLAIRGGWPLPLAGPLLFAAGVGHAVGFSPLTHRLSTLVRPAQAADLSGLVLTADWIGTVLGVASFAGIYLSSAAHGPARGLATTTEAIAVTLLATAACAGVAVRASSQRLSTTTECPAGT